MAADTAVLSRGEPSSLREGEAAGGCWTETQVGFWVKNTRGCRVCRVQARLVPVSGSEPVCRTSGFPPEVCTCSRVSWQKQLSGVWCCQNNKRRKRSAEAAGQSSPAGFNLQDVGEAVQRSSVLVFYLHVLFCDNLLRTGRDVIRLCDRSEC